MDIIARHLLYILQMWPSTSLNPKPHIEWLLFNSLGCGPVCNVSQRESAKRLLDKSEYSLEFGYKLSDSSMGSWFLFICFLIDSWSRSYSRNISLIQLYNAAHIVRRLLADSNTVSFENDAKKKHDRILRHWQSCSPVSEQLQKYLSKYPLESIVLFYVACVNVHFCC